MNQDKVIPINIILLINYNATTVYEVALKSITLVDSEERFLATSKICYSTTI